MRETIHIHARIILFWVLNWARGWGTGVSINVKACMCWCKLLDRRKRLPEICILELWRCTRDWFPSPFWKASLCSLFCIAQGNNCCSAWCMWTSTASVQWTASRQRRKLTSQTHQPEQEAPLSLNSFSSHVASVWPPIKLAFLSSTTLFAVQIHPNGAPGHLTQDQRFYYISVSTLNMLLHYRRI